MLVWRFKMRDKEDSIWEVATLGGGCFWCLEVIYLQQPGVAKVVSGYAGGHDPQPNYESVCRGQTGHAEVIQITYDRERVTFEDLLDLFWQAHQPTTLNRQGNDVGTQYRSIILFHDDAQREAALKSRQAAQARFQEEIVTEIAPLETFFPAEAYHQDYYQRNPNQAYCAYVIRPKLAKLGLAP